MKGERTTYTTPTIVRGKDGDWFVFFRYWNELTGEMQPFKIRKGLNRIQNLKEKEAEFKALRDAREQLLIAGWNPVTDTLPTLPVDGFEQLELDLAVLKKMTFTKALDYSYRMKYNDWSHKSRQDFNSKIKYFKEAALRIGIAHSCIVDLKRLHYRVLLEKVRETRKLSAKGYNVYKDYLSSLMGQLEADEILEYNPIHKIKAKDAIKIVAHKPPTKDQQTLIINRIREQHRPYYRFLAILYGCTIRPKEICALKIKNLHRLEQEFRMLPDNESSTKTKSERQVAIPDWVMRLLMELNLHNFDPEWYIFSTRNKYGTFTPGPNRMHSNTPTKWWWNIVKAPVEEGGLAQDVDQYSLKKLSGNDMVKMQRQEQADNLLKLPMSQMGHSKPEMTAVYVDEHVKVMKELVKRKMPVL